MHPSASGEPLHTRSISVTLSRGEAGGLEARGDLVDLRKQGFVPLAGELQGAGIIHHMTLVAGVDTGTRRLERLEAEQPFVAFEPSRWTRGECCRDPIDRLQELVGERCDAGLTKRLGEELGGPRGCSHILTLAQTAASVVPRALDLEEKRGFAAERRPGERVFRRSIFVDGFERSDGSIQLALRLADLHTAPAEGVAHPLDRLGGQHEVRARAVLELKGMSLSELEAEERVRDGESIADADWRDRSAELTDLVGRGVMSGLGRELLRRFADQPERWCLRDALLNLAPGAVQCMPALLDRLVRRGGKPSGAERPAYMDVGGGIDSCYMWRSDGALVQIRSRMEQGRPLDSSEPGEEQ